MHSKSEASILRFGGYANPHRTITQAQPDHQSTLLVLRHTEDRNRTALSDTRIVAVVGARQSGMTTLARKITDGEGRRVITPDDDQYSRFA